MFTVEPLRRGKPISFAECWSFSALVDAVEIASKRNALRENHPEFDDGLRFDVYQDRPAGDSALVWSHRLGPTFVG